MIREIPFGEWAHFCRNFSRKHNGWLVTIESLQYDGNYRVLTREHELDEVSIRSRTVDGPVAAIEVSGTGSGRKTMIVPALSTMKAEYNAEGEEKSLEIHSENQGMTIIRVAARPAMTARLVMPAEPAGPAIPAGPAWPSVRGTSPTPP